MGINDLLPSWGSKNVFNVYSYPEWSKKESKNEKREKGEKKRESGPLKLLSLFGH